MKTPKEYNWDIQQIKDLLDHTERKRRIGRTTVMAKAYVLLAYENPEALIKIMDHWPSSNAVDHMMSVVADEIRDWNAKQEETFDRARFWINPKDRTLIFTARRNNPAHEA